jgi:hypothetical protein
MRKLYGFSISILITLIFQFPVYSFGDFFVENKGQIVDFDGKVRNDIICYATLEKCKVYVTTKGLSFVWNENETKYNMNSILEDSNSTYTITRVDADLINANFQEFSIENKNITVFNYYLSYLKDTITDVSTFNTASINNIYPNIDLYISIEKSKLKLDFYTSDLAIINNVKLRSSESLQSRFNPENYYETDFHLKSEKKPYNEDKKVSDKTQEFNANIEWSTFLGGEDLDFCVSVTTDPEGNIVVGGITQSSKFPVTEGVFQKNKAGDLDVFITKLTPEGNLIWSTYIGGSYFDTLNDLEVASDSTIWYCGESRSTNYPLTSDAYQKNYGGDIADGVFGHFTNSGKRKYISFYGGNGYDTFNELAINSKGSVFFTGPNTSSNFPVSDNAVRKTTTGGYEGFLVGFDKNHIRLYSTYWGGSYDDWGEGITIDNKDNIIIMGYTLSKDYMTKNPFQKDLKGGLDGYLAKFDSSYNLKWSTYLGGSGNDYSNKLKHDKNNNLFLRGCTTSNDIPVTNDALQKIYGGNKDLFIMKYDENGSLKMATYFGGKNEEGWDHVNTQYGGIDIDKFCNVAISGNTNSKDLTTTTSAYQKSLGNNDNNIDSYIIVLDSLNNLVYSSYFGGTGNDKGYDVCWNKSGDLINVGYTSSPNFPIINKAYQPKIQGGFDGYIIKFAPPLMPKDTCDETEFYFMDFANDDNIVFTGKSFRNQDYLRLTNPMINRVGAVWYKYLMPLRNGFTTKFRFRMSEGLNGEAADSSYPGADGIAFVIQNNNTKIYGGNGGRIGYDPIPNSLAVEYDLFSNDKHQIEILNDPNGNHVAVMSLGKEPNSCNHTSGAELGINKDILEIKSNNKIYYSKIDYNIEPGVMRVYLSENENDYSNPIIEVKNLDLTKLLNLYGDEWAYVGFTSATGSSYQNHDILSWEFCPKPTDSQQTGVEEEVISEQGGLVLYPNPVEDELVVNIGNIQSAVLTIYDLTGMIAKAITITGSYGKIDISDLSAGCWFAKIETSDGKVFFEKFVKK